MYAHVVVAEARLEHPEPEERGGQDRLAGAVPGPRGGGAVPGARGADAAEGGHYRARVVRAPGDEEGGAARRGGAGAGVLRRPAAHARAREQVRAQ